jgi:hypothetical protein
VCPLKSRKPSANSSSCATSLKNQQIPRLHTVQPQQDSQPPRTNNQERIATISIQITTQSKMPFLVSQYYQHCMEADDFSTVVASVASTEFASAFYRATGFPRPALKTTTSSRSSLKRGRSPESAASEPEHQPRKRAKKLQTSTKPSPIRLRLTQPRPPPTGIKLRLRNPAARPQPIKIRLRNPAVNFKQTLKTRRPKRSPPNKVWFFRNQEGKWCGATNDQDEAQWLREVFACARWIKGVEESRPTSRLLRNGARMPRTEEEGWQKNLCGWDAELRPEDALGV